MADDAQSILAVGDDEYVLGTGSHLRIYSDHSHTSQFLAPQIPECTLVQHCTLSADASLLAVVVNKKEKEGVDHDVSAVLYIYDMVAQLKHKPQKPKKISYVPEKKPDQYGPLSFLCSAISNDNTCIAAALNIGELGVVVYDVVLLKILVKVGTTTLLKQISFNPYDSTKLCTIGHKNNCAMWRITPKSAYVSPVHALTQVPHNIFTCMTWLEGEEEARFIAGSHLGYMLLVQNGDQVGPPVWPFGTPEGYDFASEQEGHVDSPVTAILERGDYVIVASDLNYIAIYEVKKYAASGTNDASATLLPCKRYCLSDVTSITGLQWCSRTVTSSFAIVLSSPAGVVAFDTRADEFGSKAGILDGPSVSPKASSKKIDSAIEWDIVKSDRKLCDFHSGGIHSLAVASRTSTIVTASSIDESVKITDFSQATGPSFVSTTFSDRKDEIPNSVDMHPSGMFVALAGEDEAIEFIVSDSHIEAVRRLPTKIPFTLPSGTPIVNMSPVSLVKYSHTGHLLAVVTGKLAQVFHMYNYKVSASDMTAVPQAIMILMDHTSPITDITFSHDDTRIYSSSVDGAVYSWKVGATERSSDYTSKDKVPATKIACNSSGAIVAAYSSAHSPGIARSPSRQGSAPIGGGGTPGSRGRHTPGSAGSGSTKLINTRSRGSRRSSVQGSDAGSDFGGGGSRIEEQAFVCVWKDDIHPQNCDIIHTGCPVTSLVLGGIDTSSSDLADVCVLGLADGRVLISLLPFPTKVISPSIPSRSTLLHAFSHDQASVSSAGNNTAIGSHFSGRSKTLIAGSKSIGEKSIGIESIMPPTRGGISAESEAQTVLNEDLCKQLQLHRDAITSVQIAISGMWIFTAGADGGVYVLSTSLRAKEMPEFPERKKAIENDFVITEREALANLRHRLGEIDTIVQDKTRESDRIINKLSEQNAAKVAEMESRMKKEMKKRDAIIIKTREEMISTGKRLNLEISKLKNNQQREVSTIEAEYERKLSKESLYLEKMRQAYDEFVLHARMDMQDFQKEVDRGKLLDKEKVSTTLKEQDKQKEALLTYIEYIKARNNEVLDSLSDAQEKERRKFKNGMSDAEEATEEAARAGRSEIASLTIETQKLKADRGKKDNDVMKLNSDLGWANERIRKLESALEEASGQLRRKTDVCEKWEYKAGETQQQVNDLERIRKALTSQLHALRQEMGPDKEKLSQTSERLQEVDREYELSLHAISEKDSSIIKRGSEINLLRKQVRELRFTTAQKERSLMRAAKILGEYKLALEEAQFKSVKQTVPVASKNEDNDEDSRIEAHRRKEKKKTEIVEIMTRSSNMLAAFRRLSDLLEPYENGDAGLVEEDEAVLAMQERERHVSALHQENRRVKHSLESTEVAAMNTVKKSLGENQVLVEEVNDMRHKIRRLTQENQRQKAMIDTLNLRVRESANTVKFGSMSLDNSFEDKFQNPDIMQSKSKHTIESYVPAPQPMYSRDLDDVNYAQGSLASVERSVDSLTHNRSEISLSKYPIEKEDGAVNKRPKGLVPRPQEDEAARMQSAEAKVAAIMMENEEKIREMKSTGKMEPGNSSAKDILSFYQGKKGNSGQAESKSDSKDGKDGKTSVRESKKGEKGRALKLSKTNSAVVLPSLTNF